MKKIIPFILIIVGCNEIANYNLKKDAYIRSHIDTAEGVIVLNEGNHFKIKYSDMQVEIYNVSGKFDLFITNNDGKYILIDSTNLGIDDKIKPETIIAFQAKQLDIIKAQSDSLKKQYCTRKLPKEVYFVVMDKDSYSAVYQQPEYGFIYNWYKAAPNSGHDWSNSISEMYYTKDTCELKAQIFKWYDEKTKQEFAIAEATKKNSHFKKLHASN